MSLIDDVLNVNTDDIEDLPEFVDPPAGVYVTKVKEVNVRTVELDDGECPVVEIRYEILGTEKLNNPAEPTVPDGSLFSESFFLKNPAFLKQYLKSVFGDAMRGHTFKELLDQLQGMKMRLVVKSTKRTTNDGEVRIYTNTRKHEVLA